MTDLEQMAERLTNLEADNARLRRLLDASGVHDGLRHAFRDTVAVLRTVLRHSAETAENVEEYTMRLEGRLDALVRVRGRVEAFGEADLHTLIADELMLHSVREGERAALQGPPVRLRPKAAQAVAIAVHELAINAIEHGPLGVAAGTLAVAWRVEVGGGSPDLVLSWTETGSRDLALQTRRGFGTMVLKDMLAYELGARSDLAHSPDGLQYSVCIPFTDRVGRLAS